MGGEIFNGKPFINKKTALDNWESYKNWVKKMKGEGKSFFYRGQLDRDWTLRTTFHREILKKPMSLVDYLDKVVSEVHYHISSKLNEIIKIEDPNEFASFLALLRHHGFPTPLLDWTMSPYIAAYFAFKECAVTKSECILHIYLMKKRIISYTENVIVFYTMNYIKL